MFKTFLATILLVPSIALAAPLPPAEVVRVTPTDAKPGTVATIEAFVYNEEVKTVTVAVLFATAAEELETIELTIPAQSGKTASTQLTTPKELTEVTVSIVKAVDANQRAVPALLGVLGKVTVGQTPSTFGIGSFGISAKSWGGKVLGAIEPWRMAQAKHFTTLRDTTREELGIDRPSDIMEKMAVRQAEPAAPKEPETTVGTPSNGVPIGSYATLLLASALATILSSAPLFYIAAILILLMVLRFGLRLFS